MEEQDQQNYYSRLISRYLSGETNAAEQQELEQWVLADSKNKKRFISFKKAWMLSGMREQENVPVDKAWKATASELFPEAKVRKLSFGNNWLRIAAAVVLLIICGTLLFQQFRQEEPFTAQTTDVTMPYDLADGTRVTLNKSSSIRFLEENDAGERKVELTGDAFFDVARDESAPFVITAQEIEIEVLGTSFYVDSRSDQTLSQVMVESGRVAVRAGEQEVVLNANEQAIYDKNTNRLIKQTNEDDNYLSLKSGELVFKNTPLEEVVFALNRYYNAKIIIEGEGIKRCSVTSTFKNKTLITVLEILEASFGIQYNQRGEEIILTGSCIGE